MSEKNDHGSVGYEKSDINLKLISGIALLSLIILVGFLVILDTFFVTEKEQQIYQSVLQPPSAQLEDVRKFENETLTTYKILDTQKGIYQIPVYQAMELLVRENLKAN